MRKSFFYSMVALLMLAFSISSCSSDDDSAPAAEEPIVEEPIAEDSIVEGSVVGYWQLVGEFNGNQQKPLTDVTVAKFGGNGVLTYYENGRPTNRMTYWLEPTEESSNLYGFHCGNSPELEGAYAGGANLLIDGDMLRIHSFGCFLNQTCFYRRIASLDDIDPELSSILYEDNPTTIEGTWCMTQVDDNLGFVSLITPSTTCAINIPISAVRSGSAMSNCSGLSIISNLQTSSQQAIVLLLRSIIFNKKELRELCCSIISDLNHRRKLFPHPYLMMLW